MSTAIAHYITAIVCIITAFVIQRIYFKEKRRSASPSSLKGIKWLGLSIFTWGIGSLLSILLWWIFGINEQHKIMIFLGVLVSLLNSLFVLMSLPSIGHNEKRNLVIKIVERFSEKEVFMLFGGVLVMIAFVFLVSFYNNNEAANNSFIWLIDIPISLIVAFALLNELNRAFSNRGMRFMYLPTYALFTLILIAVIHRIIPDMKAQSWIAIDQWRAIGMITALSFKVLFILLFTILLYSWKLLAEKEEQQGELESLQGEKLKWEQEKETLILANESHIDTIKHLKDDYEQLKKRHKKLKRSSKVVLSDRQKEVLANLGVCGDVKSYTEIAEAMNISVDGFQTHIYQIKKVLNISGSGGKEQLIAYAKENDILRYATVNQGGSTT